MDKPIKVHRSNAAMPGGDPDEAKDALIDGWSRRRRDGDNYEVLGRTSKGRYLQLVCEETAIEVRVFHVRDMTWTERRRYGKN
jgi:hypothetical protein